MKLDSVNVGTPKEVSWNGKTVLTSIFKQPVQGRVKANTLNLDGDTQADLTVHGGPDMAVYAYPANHYEGWRQELPNVEFHHGKFGENLTIDGLQESEVRVGDRFEIGSATFEVSQPRMPCFKLGIRFNDPLMVKRMMDNRRNGFYFRVIKEGELGAGDAVTLLSRNPEHIRIADVVGLYADDKHNKALLEQAIATSALAQGWREHFETQLKQLD